MYILILMLFLNSIVMCNSIEDGWQGVKPLTTNKTAVDKLWGTPKINDNGFYGYTTENAFIQVNYSIAHCEGNKYEGDEYNVAKNTVLNYTVYFKKKIKLSDLEFEREKYIKETAEHLTGVSYYISENEGVRISVQSQEGVEYIDAIGFKPNQKNAGLFKCVN